MEEKNGGLQKTEDFYSSKELDRIIKMAENLIQVEQNSLKNEDEKKKSSTVSFSSEEAPRNLKIDDNFDTIIEIAKKLVNPELLSLLFKFGTKNELKPENFQLNSLEQSIEQLTSEVQSLKDEIAFIKEHFMKTPKRSKKG